MIDKINETIEKYKNHQKNLNNYDNDFWSIQNMINDLEELKKLAEREHESNKD